MKVIITILICMLADASLFAGQLLEHGCHPLGLHSSTIEIYIEGGTKTVRTIFFDDAQCQYIVTMNTQTYKNDVLTKQTDNRRKKLNGITWRYGE